jgi:hypothetical protein
VDYGIRIRDRGIDGSRITNVTFDEPVSLVVFQVTQVVPVTCICQFVKVGHMPVRVRLERMPDEVAADKAASASYCDAVHFSKPHSGLPVKAFHPGCLF